MSCPQCVKYISQQKIIILCFTFITAFLFFLLAVCWVSPPLPKAVDIQIQRKGFAPICEQVSCAYQWISKYQAKGNLDDINQICPGYNWIPLVNKTLGMYQEEKIDWVFLQEFYDHISNHYCQSDCGLLSAFRYFSSFHKFVLDYSKAWMENELCSAPFIDSCAWRGYSVIFRIYFSYFSIPLTIIFNYINLTTLLRLLESISAGPAIYLHAAEIVTDGLLNIIVGVYDCLEVFNSIDKWRESCGYFQYTSSVQSMYIVKRIVSFLNQAYLLGLLADRLYALTKPFQYNNISDVDRKKRAKSFILHILLASFTLFLPFMIFYMFSPIMLHWTTKSDFWNANLNRIDLGLSSFYMFIGYAMLISQIICGVLVGKKFTMFIENKMEMNQESEVELKKRERDKQMLLIGTIGLNVITTSVSTALNTITNSAFYKILGYNDNYRPWFGRLVFMADPVLAFLNGNGALVIHIIFIHSYRQAFKATSFGRLVFRNQIHSA